MSATIRRTSEPTLTADEHRAMDLTVELVNLLSEIMGDGRPRAGDLHEVVFHIHGIQRMVLSQAAARAYPDRYRLLGVELPPEVDQPRAAEGGSS